MEPWEKGVGIMDDLERQLDILRAVMKRRSLTVSAVSRLYHIPYRSLQDWLSGKRRPPAYAIRLLSACLNERVY